MPAPPAAAPAATPPAAAPAAAPKTSAAAAPPPATPSDDAIIGEILKGKSAEAREPGNDDAEDTPAEPAADEAAAEADEGGEDEDDDAGHEPEPSTDEDDDAAAAGDLPPELVEARKLLEEGDIDKAFELAFGKKPEEILPDSKVWTKWRLANEKRDKGYQQREHALATRQQQNEQWVEGQRQQINAVIQQLRPYEEIQQARIAFKQTGDPSFLVKLVELTAEMPYDEAQKIILTKTRRSPTERKLAEKVQTLEQRLEEAERKRSEETTQQTQAQIYQGDLQVIRGQLSGEVTLVPRFAERVYKVLADTRTPTGLAMSIEEAGRRVLAHERRKLQKHPLLAKKPAPAVSQAAATLAKARKGKGAAAASPPLRRDSRSTTAVDPATQSDDDIIADILGKGKARPIRGALT